ncbi:MAG TPA: glycosyltransferase, partial [Chitinophagaceae bacterium]
MVLIAITIIVFIFYAAIIFYYWRSWESVPEYLPAATAGRTISVIVAARNEEQNILHCLDSIAQQEAVGVLVELIVVDDASEDSTWRLLREFGSNGMDYQPLHLDPPSNDPLTAFKKRAIAYAIDHARHELVVTTDADCVLPPQWLSTISSFAEETKAMFIAAPVAIAQEDSMLNRFERLDFLILQGITAASVHRKLHAMCNGANIAYLRAAFQSVNGFD